MRLNSLNLKLLANSDPDRGLWEFLKSICDYSHMVLPKVPNLSNMESFYQAIHEFGMGWSPVILLACNTHTVGRIHNPVHLFDNTL
jgi:hypothetical protein